MDFEQSDRVRLALKGVLAIVGAQAAFIVSVVLFPLLVVAAGVGLVAVALGEVCSIAPRRSTARYVCWSWLILVVPSFGVMPLLLAGRAHVLLMGSTLAIFSGFTLSAAYDLIAPSPGLWVWDHPFPPLGAVELAWLGVLTLATSLASVDVLLQLRRPQSAELSVAPEPAQRSFHDPS